MPERNDRESGESNRRQLQGLPVIRRNVAGVDLGSERSLGVRSDAGWERSRNRPLRSDDADDKTLATVQSTMVMNIWVASLSDAINAKPITTGGHAWTRDAPGVFSSGISHSYHYLAYQGDSRVLETLRRGTVAPPIAVSW